MIGQCSKSLAPMDQKLYPILSLLKGPKKKLVVLKRGDYPTAGFPSTLQHLQVSGVRLARIDGRQELISTGLEILSL